MQIRLFKQACNHVHIKDVNGKLLRTYTVDDFRDAWKDGDDHLLAQMKRDIRTAGLQNATLAEKKTHIEAQDYDV